MTNQDEPPHSTSDLLEPERNKKSLFEYQCSEIQSIIEYDHKDSIISTTLFEFIYDEFGNWDNYYSIEQIIEKLKNCA